MPLPEQPGPANAPAGAGVGAGVPADHAMLLEGMPYGAVHCRVPRPGDATAPAVVILWANPAMGHLLGVDRDRLIGKRSADLADLQSGAADDLKSWLDRGLSVVATGESLQFEHRRSGGGPDLHLVAYATGPDSFVLMAHEAASSLATGDGGSAQLDEQIRRAEQEFRTIWEHSPIAIELYDGDGRSLNANRACLDLAGVTDPADLRGFSIFDEPNLPEDAAAELRGGRSVRFRSRYSFDSIRARGLFPTSRTGTAEMDVLITPLGADGQTVGGYLLQIQDISDRVAAEAALERSEQSYRAIVEDQVELVARYLPDGTITFANGAFCRAVGLPREEVIGTTRWPVEPPEDHGVAWVGPDWFCPERSIRQSEHRVVIADGSVRWQQWSDRAFFDEAGNVVELQSVGRDITERVRAEQAVRESEERYRMLAENMQDALLYQDTTTQLRYVNPAAERLTGYSAQELLNDPQVIDRCLSPEDRRCLIGLWQDALDSGVTSNTELRLLTRTGESKWASVTLAPLLDRDGSRVGAQALVADITEQRRLQEQLLQAHKMESVGRLAGGVAHDFNNLLTAISGYAEFVLDQLDENAAARSDILEVLRNAERASHLTRQLLAFSRKQTMSMHPVDLNALVGNMGRLLRRLIGEHIELTLLLGDGLAPVQADTTQLEQVLANLAVNARDAMPNGGRLTISTTGVCWRSQADAAAPARVPGEYVRLDVADTGHGMAEAVLTHLFEPFFTTKELGQGTGLGLATVYGIVKQHGGDITVSSRVGEGTVFSVYLPVVRQDDAGTLAESGRIAAAGGGGETIMLVEDEAVVRTTLRRSLERQGYHVLEAGDGEQALRLLERSEPPALLITDLVMPHMGGLELTRRLRPRYPDLRILYISGYTEETSDLATAVEAGDAYLQKPFSSAELAVKVREALQRR
ncbi:MAG: hybrid sensor histidine kinase/response regulator [Anaerolineae bacterium]